jgi:outer membrane protein assembly factor BamB
MNIRIYILSLIALTLSVAVNGSELKDISSRVHDMNHRSETLQSKTFQPKIEVLAKIETNSTSFLQPIFSNDKIFVTNESGVITCYDTTGKQIWKNDSNGELVSLPAVVDNYLISGTTNGDINEVKSISGEQVQSIGIDDPITTGINFTDYNGKNELPIPKSTNSKTAIVYGTASGKIFCYDLETLQEYWNNSDAHKRIRFNPVITGTKILFSCMDGYIYCIESGSGLLIWRWKESAENGFNNSLILTDGKYIYAVSSDKVLYCIDLLLGKLVWKSKGNNIFPSISFSKDEKNVIAESTMKKIISFSSEKGKITKEINLTAEFDSTSVPAIDIGIGLLYSSQGNLFVVNNNSQEENIFSFGGINVNSITRIDERRFMAASAKGTIIIFSVR